MPSLHEIEGTYGFTLPERHRQMMEDPEDAIHEDGDFLVSDSKFELLRIQDVNAFLHSETHPDPWPDHLVAFASNGCGDYFAYDLRDDPPTIIYMEPSLSVEENFACPDKITYPSFDAWLASKAG